MSASTTRPARACARRRRVPGPAAVTPPWSRCPGKGSGRVSAVAGLVCLRPGARSRPALPDAGPPRTQGRAPGLRAGSRRRRRFLHPRDARPPAMAVHRRRCAPHSAADARSLGDSQPSPPIFAERQKLLLHWLPNAEPLDLSGLTHLLHGQNPTAVAEGLAGLFARHPLPEEPLLAARRKRRNDLSCAASAVTSQGS